MPEAMEKVVKWDCYVIRGKQDNKPQRAIVYVGDADKPGWRAKDGEDAQRRRKETRQEVADALGIPLKCVRAQATYSCLTANPETGLIERRDNLGGIIGTHLPTDKA